MMKAFGGRGTLSVTGFPALDFGPASVAFDIGPVGIKITEFAPASTAKANWVRVESLESVSALLTVRTYGLGVLKMLFQDTDAIRAQRADVRERDHCLIGAFELTLYVVEGRDEVRQYLTNRAWKQRWHCVRSGFEV